MGCCKSKPESEVITRKLTVIGNNRVGKTCLIQRFVKDEFEEDTPEAYIPSALQVDEKEVELKDGRTIQLHIYDAGGKDSFKHLRKLNYPRSDAALICFGLDDRDSLKDVEEYWVPELRKICPDIPVLLVGLKRDMRDEARTIENFVRESHGHNMAKKQKLTAYLECSSATGQGVKQVFDLIAKEAAKKKNMSKVKSSELSRV